MIRPLRKRHARVMRVLAVVLPVGFVAALLAREEPQVSGRLPDEGPILEAPMRTEQRVFAGLDILTRVGRTEGRTVVELEPREELRVPDLIVYWTSTVAPTDAGDDALPSDAHLLGALGEHARRFALPRNASGGSLVLYDMGNSEVVAMAPLPR